MDPLSKPTTFWLIIDISSHNVLKKYKKTQLDLELGLHLEQGCILVFLSIGNISPNVKNIFRNAEFGLNDIISS